jgi:hypothetical protein
VPRLEEGDLEDPKSEAPATDTPSQSGSALSVAQPAGSFSAVTVLRDARGTSLTAALRVARIENADFSAAAADIRSAEIAKLEILKDRLRPVLAQLPRDCDLFDVGVTPGDRPRLFIDQIGFVEMERDRRNFRFLQDTRHGRISIADSEDMDTIVEAVTAYIAHRLIERERALASDYTSGGAAAAQAARSAAATSPPPPASARQGSQPLWLQLFPAFLVLVELLGAALFFSMLCALGFWVYKTYFSH